MSNDGPARLTPLPPDEWGDEQYAAFGSLLGIPGDKVPRAGSGHRFDPARFDVVGTMVRHPALAKAFWVLSEYQIHESTLPVRWRELSILRVAHNRQSAYEWGQHVKLALTAGITDDEIEHLSQGNLGFDGADLVVLEATDELLTDGRLGDTMWERVHAELDTKQVMDLIFVVGTYNMLAMAFDSWRLVPEPDSAPLPARQPSSP